MIDAEQLAKMNENATLTQADASNDRRSVGPGGQVVMITTPLHSTFAFGAPQVVLCNGASRS